MRPSSSVRGPQRQRLRRASLPSKCAHPSLLLCYHRDHGMIIVQLACVANEGPANILPHPCITAVAHAREPSESRRTRRGEQGGHWRRTARTWRSWTIRLRGAQQHGWRPSRSNCRYGVELPSSVLL